MYIFAFSLFLVAALAEDDDLVITPGYTQPKVSGRGGQRSCVTPTTFPPNLKIRTQGKGRIMRFMCSPGSLLVGKRFSTCLRGHWSSPPPICVSKGCPAQTAPPNGRVRESYDGAILTFDCNPGYAQNGSSTIYCAIHQWNDTVPTCTVPTVNPKVSCDFEDTDLCGWSHDVTHDFEWKRNKFSTPSGHVGTGPSFDHTLGKGQDGHYMYLEASSPQKPGDITRLFSPVYPTVQSGSCFTFWYHMYGSAIGSLRVYLKEENQVLAELAPVWSKDHETGNIWLQGQIDVPRLIINFQLVIEGVRGSDYMGDIAVDDVSLIPGSCPVQSNQSEPVQGQVTSGTITDEGGGTGKTEIQNFTQMSTSVYTGEATVVQSLTTVTKEPGTTGTAAPITSVTITGTTSSPSNTKELITSTTSTPKIQLTTVEIKTTTTAITQQQPASSVIDTSNSTQSADQTSQTSDSKTTEVFRKTEAPTINYRPTSVPLTTVTISPSMPEKITTLDHTQPYPNLSSTTLQSTVTINPTTKFRFPKFTTQTRIATTSVPVVSTTYSTRVPIKTTKRFPFIIKRTTPFSTTSTTVSNKINTSSAPQTNIPSTTSTTTPTVVPTTVSINPITTTTTTSLPTTKATTSPSTSTTRKPFIYIVPKTTRTVTNSPLALSDTTQSEQLKSTFPLSPKTSQASTQYSITIKQNTTKRGMPSTPPKITTTPTSTSDLVHLFPHSTEEEEEEDTEEDEDDHSRQNDNNSLEHGSEKEPDSVTDSETSARVQEFPRRPHPRTKQTAGAGVSALATACSLGALVLVVSMFAIIYFVRRRKIKHQRFGSISEMRFITRSEELEVGSPDNSDMIRLI